MGGTMPMPQRPLTAVSVRTGGGAYLLDCGEGSQVPLRARGAGMGALRLIAITHLHGDHCLGLPGLLASLTLNGRQEPLTLVGPKGLEAFMGSVFHHLNWKMSFPQRFIELDAQADFGRKGPPPTAYEDKHISLRWLPLRHRIPCVGYRLQEHPRPGRFSVQAAQRLGLPPGPLYGQLQRGQAVQAPDGSNVDPSQVLGAPRPGRAVCLCTDTAACPNLYRLLDGADLAFVEGMFLQEHRELGVERMHLTAAEAGRIVARAGPRQAVLVHISPRYRQEQLPELEAEAQVSGAQVRMGASGERFSIPLVEEEAS